MKDDFRGDLRAWLLCESAAIAELAEEWIQEHFPGEPIDYQPDAIRADESAAGLNLIRAMRLAVQIDESQIATDGEMLQKLAAFHTASKFIFGFMAGESARLKAGSTSVRDRMIREARSELARMAALERIKNDPKQREKELIFNCWKQWRIDLTRYRSKAEFARKMLEKCDHLDSQKKIEDWCREWEKNGTLPAE